MFLVDTSIWVDHFIAKEGNALLTEVLEIGFVYFHPLVLGELLLGGFYRNSEIRKSLLALPRMQEPRSSDVMEFIQNHNLMGKGVDWVDSCLIYSGIESRMQFLTMDRKLAEVYIEVAR